MGCDQILDLNPIYSKLGTNKNCWVSSEVQYIIFFNFLSPLKFGVNNKIKIKVVFTVKFCLKIDADGTANSEDPDQTAPM